MSRIRFLWFLILLGVLGNSSTCEFDKVDFCLPPAPEQLFPTQHPEFVKHRDDLENLSDSNLDKRLFYEKNRNINHIKIDSYNYDGSIVYGDASLEEIRNITNPTRCQRLAALDRMSSKPMLKWKAVGEEFITLAAIFDKHMKLRGDVFSLADIESAVWLWHSKGTFVRSSGYVMVDYDNGGKYDDDINNLEEALPLEPGKIYWWAVWASSKENHRITHSSFQIPFVVEEFSVDVVSNTQLSTGEWALEKARDVFSEDQITDFCLQSITFGRFPCNSDAETREIELNFTTNLGEEITMDVIFDSENEVLFSGLDGNNLSNCRYEVIDLKMLCDDKILVEVQGQDNSTERYELTFTR